MTPTLWRVQGRIYCYEEPDKRRKHDTQIVHEAQLESRVDALVWRREFKSQIVGRCQCGQPLVCSTQIWEPG